MLRIFIPTREVTSKGVSALDRRNQKAAADGHIGTRTMLAIAEHRETDQRALVEAYIDARRSYLSGLADFDAFGRGWLYR